jgi:hypothetical protein
MDSSDSYRNCKYDHFVSVNAALASVADCGGTFRVCYGCREEPNENGCLHVQKITSIVDHNTAAV